MVSQQGSVLLATLAVAAEKQQMIFSAAGNEAPARGGHPCHIRKRIQLGGQKAREQGIISGIVVEAHDSSVNAAGFSNGPGDIPARASIS